jgi:hypothetical protein
MSQTRMSEPELFVDCQVVLLNQVVHPVQLDTPIFAAVLNVFPHVAVNLFLLLCLFVVQCRCMASADLNFVH